MDTLYNITSKEMDRYNVIKRLINNKISEEAARKLIGLKSTRQIRRIKKRVIKENIKGIIHNARGKVSNRKFDDDFVKKIIEIITEKYSDFKPTFASEKLLENHNIKINKESLRQIMAKNGLWKIKSRKKPKNHHEWRERMPNFGEMQQFDGSYHLWLENRYGEELCLLLAVDDATGRITHAKFDKNEGTVAVFKFWLEYFEIHGLPISIYMDKFSTYKINHKCAVDNKNLKTQFQRAMDQVGVKTITANSPEAKGRVERMNATLQDRLVKELRLANISTVEDANKFLKDYIPKFNNKFAVVPQKNENLHKEINKKTKRLLHQIFSIQSQRKVNNDYTIIYKNKFFQLEEKQPITVFKKDTVMIEKHLDGEIKIRKKDKYLNYFELPERPKKIKDIPIAALTNRKVDYKVPANHPWKRMVINPEKQKSVLYKSNKITTI